MKMKVLYNGEVIGSILTNRNMNIEEALWSLGYDINNPDDCQKAYEDGFAAAYIDDFGKYQIVENMDLDYND